MSGASTEPWLIGRLTTPPSLWLMAKKGYNLYPPTSLSQVEHGQFLYPLEGRGSQKAGVLLDLLLSLHEATAFFVRNWQFAPTPTHSVGTSSDASGDLFEEVARAWTMSDVESIEAEIGRAKVVRAPKRNAREALVVSSHAQLKSIARARRAAVSGIRHFADAGVAKLGAFVGLEDLQVQRLCMDTGALVSCGVMDWPTTGLFTSHALLPLGAPALGTPPLARTICGLVAKATQPDPQRPTFPQA